MKTLYNEYNAAVGPDAQELSALGDNFAEAIMSNYEARGYNPREVAHILIGAISTVESEHVIRNAMKLRKSLRKQLDKST